MKHQATWLMIMGLLLQAATGIAQTLPGDSVAFGPMFSTVYNDSVRVWVMTKGNTGSGKTYSLELQPADGGAIGSGVVYNADDRLGFSLRSYVYKGIQPGKTYIATIKQNGVATYRTATITSQVNSVNNFTFLAGGCGRIMDMTRCVDQVEGPKHVNGTPDIYKHMATEKSDLMVWLGDAVYLFGIEHSDGLCPGMVNDWDTRDALFSRYYFNRQFHDTLLRAMPQLAITDNHDVGGNEFNKTMPTLGLAKTNFMNWWQNPSWMGNPDGQGMYSSYRYKDVEYFLLDNRSYRESTTRHLGVYQLAWLKDALKRSTATFKVLVSGTPAFAKYHGGRNFAITTECDTLIQYIKDNNINGVMCYSADIHNQEFFGRYNDTKYPFFDVLSGNLASDIGSGGTTINPEAESMFFSAAQTYMRTSVYGDVGNRRSKIEYVSPEGVVYYTAIIHEDMLKSIDDSTKKINLGFAGSLLDSTGFHRSLQSSNVNYTADHTGTAASALQFNTGSSVSIPYSSELDMQDRTFSITCWVRPDPLPASGYQSIFSNSTGNNGYTLGIDNAGHPFYMNHATGKTYTTTLTLATGNWCHLTWKYDNVKLQLYLYYNGRLVQKWSGVATPTASTGNLYLGTSYNNSHFIGAIDEFNIYGKLIADTTIQQQSNYSPGRGSALVLNGSQQVLLPSSEVNTVFSNGFTVESWARITADPAAGGKLLSVNGRVNNVSTGFSLEFSDANRINVAFGNNGSGWTSISEAGYPWQLNEWNHIALTAKPNDSLYLYINGEQAGSVKYDNYVPNAFGLSLGNSVAYGNPIQGEMEELRIWNTPLPQDSIRKRMFYTLDGNESNLAYYYNFDKAAGGAVSSNGANHYDLALNGAALTASTAPLASIAPQCRSLVNGGWSLRRDTNTGLSLQTAITDYTINLVAGKEPSTDMGSVPNGSNMYYLKGGWQLSPLGLPPGTLAVTLADALPKYDSLKEIASGWYLIKRNATGFNVVNTGYFDGKTLQLNNTFVDTGMYYLAWKVDTSSHKRGKALSLLSGHNITIPAAKANRVLGGAFTLEFWARLMQDPGTNNSLVSDHGRVNNNTTGLSIEFPDNNSLNAVMGTGGSGWNTISSPTAWQLGEWNHVAITAAPNDTFKLYINGALASKALFTGFVGNTIDLKLGGSINYANQCIATMDEIRFWSRVKTQKEIQEQMHLSVVTNDPSLQYNFTFNQANNGYAVSTAPVADSVVMTGIQLIPSTAPIGNIAEEQQDHVTGTWSMRDSGNAGLKVAVSVPDFETNVVIGKDSLTGSSNLAGVNGGENLRRQWQIDPLKVATGEFEFDGNTVLGDNWPPIKARAIEYYLLKRDDAGQLVIQAVGQAQDDKIQFAAINMGYGLYTLGWKNNVTGSIDTTLSLTWGTIKASIRDAASNLVEWQTWQEHNTRYFNIERSENGSRYYTIGTVNAHGETDTLSNYAFIDDSLNTRMLVYYYRLKQVGVSGRYTYSVAVRLERPSSHSGDMVVTPNPGRSSDITISFPGIDNEKASLLLTDISGRVVVNSTIVLSGNPQKLLPPVPHGVYVLVVKSDGHKWTKKIVVL